MQRTCQRLYANGFEEVNTVECLRRVHEFRYQHRSKIRFTADQQAEEPIETLPETTEAVEQENSMDTTLTKIEGDETTETKPTKREAIDPVDGEATSNKKLKNGAGKSAKKQAQEADSFLTAIGPLVMPGHTGYLTFSYLKQV